MRHSPLPANASMKWTELRYHINFKTHTNLIFKI